MAGYDEGYDDGFAGFATGASGGNPGSRLRFVVHASNSCVPLNRMPMANANRAAPMADAACAESNG